MVVSYSISSEEALLLEEAGTYLMRLKTKVKKSTSFLEKLPEPVSSRVLQVKSCFKLRRLQYECDKLDGDDIIYDCKVLTLAMIQQ